MRCFKPKVGSSTVMEDIPDHLPDIFKIYDIIDGPLNFLPLCGKKWEEFFIISRRYPTSAENI